MNKAQKLMAVNESLGYPTRPTIRLTGAIGRRMGGKSQPEPRDMRLRDYWAARDYVDRQVVGRERFQKAKIKQAITDLKRQRKSEIGSLRGKKAQAFNLYKMQLQQARDAARAGEIAKGKYYKADIDKQIKKSQYKQFGIPGKTSGMANAKAISAAPSHTHSDIGNHGDVIDVEWTHLDNTGPKQLALPAPKRGRGRPKGSGKNPPRVAKKPPGSGPGRPRKEPALSPADL